MAEYTQEALANLENVPAISISGYTLSRANQALDVDDDCMNWAMFGVGGPA